MTTMLFVLLKPQNNFKNNESKLNMLKMFYVIILHVRIHVHVVTEHTPNFSTCTYKHTCNSISYPYNYTFKCLTFLISLFYHNIVVANSRQAKTLKKGESHGPIVQRFICPKVYLFKSITCY